MSNYQAGTASQAAKQRARAQAAMMQYLRLMREAQSDAVRLNLADQAREKGETLTACRIYLSVAGSRMANPSTIVARQRLADMGQEARQKMTEIDGRLSQWGSLSADDELDPEALTRLSECIADLRELADQYGRVPQVGRELKTALTKHRNRPVVKAAMFEPDARRLWDEAQTLESEGEICCAFLLYEEAVRKLPAPSAQSAQERLEQLKADPRNVAAAESCRNLQWCHQQYRSAERLARVEPERARELFRQIVERSPADSAIHAEARDHLDRLRR